MKKLVLGGVYQHYKGTKVKVITEGLHSETLEEMVVYLHLEDGAIWIRPKKMFLEKIIKDKKLIERFKLIKSKVLVTPTPKR